VKTITFYSYKGGTGRSLTLANAALYLRRLDFKVVVIDFDLEAPGLHYKFAADPDKGHLPVSKGLIDYIDQFISDGTIDKELSDYCVRIWHANASTRR
jgi:MinD-like ATPase involved in chromosome partitioning or flagellar assembly